MAANKLVGIEQFKYEGTFSIKAEKPSYETIKDAAGNIIDYKNVKLDGYANTFNMDRGGELVIPGSFADHLEEFLSNPILLVDHVRDTGFAAGQVQSAYEDNIGLKITAMLSNSPSEKMKDIRFKAVERILRTFSIGGIFHGQALGDKVVINKVELREVSIVTVPMNKESLFEVKSETGNQIKQGRVSEKMKFYLVEDEQPKIYLVDNGVKLEIIN